MNANKNILPPLIVALGLITYRGVRSGSSANNPVAHLPVPNQFVGAMFVFATLSLFSGRAEKPATVAAWGLNVAILLNLWSPGKTPATTPAQAPLATAKSSATTPQK